MNPLDILKSWTPTGTELHFGAAASAIGTAFSAFIGWNDAVEALCLFMLIDYITGVLAAYENPTLKLNSMRGFHGICKKIMILLLVATSHELEKATGIPAIESLVVWFFLGNEGLSIVTEGNKLLHVKRNEGEEIIVWYKEKPRKNCHHPPRYGPLLLLSHFFKTESLRLNPQNSNALSRPKDPARDDRRSPSG